MGQTRRGKSTILNWMTNKALEAVKVDKNICYKVIQNVLDGALIGDGYESCTLVPNIERGIEVSIGDTAGFADNIDYIRVLGVSYALQAIFDHLSKVKFILVVDETELNDSNGKSFSQSLNYFLNMFNLSKLELTERTKIYRSVTLLVNMAKSKT